MRLVSLLLFGLGYLAQATTEGTGPPSNPLKPQPSFLRGRNINEEDRVFNSIPFPSDSNPNRPRGPINLKSLEKEKIVRYELELNHPEIIYPVFKRDLAGDNILPSFTSTTTRTSTRTSTLTRSALESKTTSRTSTTTRTPVASRTSTKTSTSTRTPKQSPSSTRSPNPTRTPPFTKTSTRTGTTSRTSTGTMTSTRTSSSSRTSTGTMTSTRTGTTSRTSTGTMTSTRSSTISRTSTASVTVSKSTRPTPSSSASPLPSRSSFFTRSASPSSSVSKSASGSVSVTRTSTGTRSASASVSSSRTSGRTFTSTGSVSGSRSGTGSGSTTKTSTSTFSITATPSGSKSSFQTVTSTASSKESRSSTRTSSETVSPSFSPSSTSSSRASFTSTGSQTLTRSPSVTGSSTNSGRESISSRETRTSSTTRTGTRSAQASLTSKGSTEASETPSPTKTASGTSTVSNSPFASRSSSSSPSVTGSSQPTGTGTGSPSASPSYATGTSYASETGSASSLPSASSHGSSTSTSSDSLTKTPEATLSSLPSSLPTDTSSVTRTSQPSSSSTKSARVSRTAGASGVRPPSNSPTSTRTSTQTRTITPTRTSTRSAKVSVSSSASVSPSETSFPSETASPSASVTQSSRESLSSTKSSRPSLSPLRSRTPTASASVSRTPSSSSIHEIVVAPTETASKTADPTPATGSTPTSTRSSESSLSSTSSPSVSASGSPVVIVSDYSTLTSSPSPSGSNSGSSTGSISASPSGSISGSITSSVSGSPSTTGSSSSSGTVSISPSPSPSAVGRCIGIFYQKPTSWMAVHLKTSNNIVYDMFPSSDTSYPATSGWVYTTIQMNIAEILSFSLYDGTGSVDFATGGGLYSLDPGQSSSQHTLRAITKTLSAPLAGRTATCGVTSQYGSPPCMGLLFKKPPTWTQVYAWTNCGLGWPTSVSKAITMTGSTDVLFPIGDGWFTTVVKCFETSPNFQFMFTNGAGEWYTMGSVPGMSFKVEQPLNEGYYAIDDYSFTGPLDKALPAVCAPFTPSASATVSTSASPSGTVSSTSSPSESGSPSSSISGTGRPSMSGTTTTTVTSTITATRSAATRSPTSSNSGTVSPSQTRSPTGTASSSRSRSTSGSPTTSASPTRSRSSSATGTITPTVSASARASFTWSASGTASRTATHSPTGTVTRSPSVTSTRTTTPSARPTISRSPSTSSSSSVTGTRSRSPTTSTSPSVTATASPSAHYIKPLAFTPGNLVILRLGDGATSVTTTAMNYVYLDEITPTGTKVQSVMIGGTDGVGLQVSGGFGIPGIVTTTDTDGTKHGQLYRSADGLFVHVAGYNAAKGTTSLTTAVPRILARIGNNPITTTGHYDVTTTRPSTTTNTYWGHFGDNAGTKNLWAIGSTTTANTGRLEYWNWGSAQTTVPTTTISLAGVVAADYFGSTIYVARESTNNICTMTNTGTTMNTGLTTGTTCNAIAASASTTNIRAIAVVSPSEIWVASYGTGPIKITASKTTITCSTSCTDVIGMTLSDDRKTLYFTTKTGFYSLTVSTGTVDNGGDPWYTIPEVNKEFRGISLAPVRNGISPSTASIASTSLVASYIEDVTRTTQAQRMWLTEFSTTGILLSNRFIVPGTAPSVVALYPAQINHGALTRSRDNTAIVMTGAGVAIGAAPVAQGTSHAKAVARMTCAGTVTYGPKWSDVNIVTGATAVAGTGTTVVHASSQGGMHYFSASTATTVTASYTTMSFTKPMYSLVSGTTYEFFAFRRLATTGQHQRWATAPTGNTAPTGSTGATGVTTITNLGGSYVQYPTTGTRRLAWVESGVGLRMISASSTTFSTTAPSATFPTGDNNLVDVIITDDGATVYAVTKNGIYSVPFGGTTWTLVAYPLAPGLSDYRGVSLAPTGC